MHGKSLVHVEMTESYSTDSFLMALRRFMTVHGAPRRFQSDQGDQLVAASKQLATWNWARVDELCSQKGATWRLVPTGGQHYNGQAEWVIGLMKLCLAQTLEGKRCSLMELATVLAEAAQAVNSWPIARSKPSDDPTIGGPITPPHLQLGRASIEIPEVQFDLSPTLTKRLKYLEDIKAEFLEEVDGPGVPGPSVSAEVEEAAPGRPGGRRGAGEEQDCSWSRVPAGKSRGGHPRRGRPREVCPGGVQEPRKASVQAHIVPHTKGSSDCASRLPV